MRELAINQLKETIDYTDFSELFRHMPTSDVDPTKNMDLLSTYMDAFISIMQPHMRSSFDDFTIPNGILYYGHEDAADEYNRELSNGGVEERYHENFYNILINPVDGKKLEIKFNRARKGTAKYVYRKHSRFHMHCTCHMEFSSSSDWIDLISTIGHELIHYVNHFEEGMRFRSEPWSKSHGKKFKKYVLIINQQMRDWGAKFRISYKVNDWYRFPEVIDTQDWMRDNIHIGDEVIWKWGKYVSVSRVVRRNAHTVSLQHRAGLASVVVGRVPWEKVLYAYRPDVPYNIDEAIKEDVRLEIEHKKEMKELKEIWGMD